jgi:hypothetical protein
LSGHFIIPKRHRTKNTKIRGHDDEIEVNCFFFPTLLIETVDDEEGEMMVDFDPLRHIFLYVLMWWRNSKPGTTRSASSKPIQKSRTSHGLQAADHSQRIFARPKPKRKKREKTSWLTNKKKN